MLKSEKLRALILSLLILGVFLVAWQIGTMPFTSAQVVDEVEHRVSQGDAIGKT